VPGPKSSFLAEDPVLAQSKFATANYNPWETS